MQFGCMRKIFVFIEMGWTLSEVLLFEISNKSGNLHLEPPIGTLINQIYRIKKP
jgi:hypothetical protein